MHGCSRQRQQRRRPRAQPYPTSVKQPQSSSAIGRGIPPRSDTRGQQFQPSPVFTSQTRSLIPTGVMPSHTNHGQPRTQPHLTSGPQRQPQQSQIVGTNVYLSPYGGLVYQSPDMARLDPSAGRHNGVACRPTTQWPLTQSDTQHPG